MSEQLYVFTTMCLKERVQGCQNSCMCSQQCVKNVIVGHLPFIDIMKKYNIRTDLVNDLISGLTVGVMHIPQGRLASWYWFSCA